MSLTATIVNSRCQLSTLCAPKRGRCGRRRTFARLTDDFESPSGVESTATHDVFCREGREEGPWRLLSWVEGGWGGSVRGEGRGVGEEVGWEKWTWREEAQRGKKVSLAR